MSTGILTAMMSSRTRRYNSMCCGWVAASPQAQMLSRRPACVKNCAKALCF